MYCAHRQCDWNVLCPPSVWPKCTVSIVSVTEMYRVHRQYDRNVPCPPSVWPKCTAPTISVTEMYCAHRQCDWNVLCPPSVWLKCTVPTVSVTEMYCVRQCDWNVLCPPSVTEMYCAHRQCDWNVLCLHRQCDWNVLCPPSVWLKCTVSTVSVTEMYRVHHQCDWNVPCPPSVWLNCSAHHQCDWNVLCPPSVWLKCTVSTVSVTEMYCVHRQCDRPGSSRWQTIQWKRCVCQLCRRFECVWPVRAVEGTNRRLDCPESLGDHISNEVPTQCQWERKYREPPTQPHSTTAVRTAISHTFLFFVEPRSCSNRLRLLLCDGVGPSASSWLEDPGVLRKSLCLLASVVRVSRLKGASPTTWTSICVVRKSCPHDS